MNDYYEPCIFRECPYNCGQLCAAKIAQSRRQSPRAASPANPLVAIVLVMVLLAIAISVAAQPVPKRHDKVSYDITKSLVAEPVAIERTAQDRQELKSFASETGAARHAPVTERTGANRLRDDLKDGAKCKDCE